LLNFLPVSYYLPNIADKVFCFITMRAGIYPAIIVVTSKIKARVNVPDKVATSIPSEKGKFIGFSAKYGLIKPKIKTIPNKIPSDA
jgi:hypothetical protein